MKHRAPFALLTVALALSAGTHASGQNYDLSLKGGQVIDPANHLNAVCAGNIV
jgi:hypothetical protein